MSLCNHYTQYKISQKYRRLVLPDINTQLMFDIKSFHWWQTQTQWTLKAKNAVVLLPYGIAWNADRLCKSVQLFFLEDIWRAATFWSWCCIHCSCIYIKKSHCWAWSLDPDPAWPNSTQITSQMCLSHWHSLWPNSHQTPAFPGYTSEMAQFKSSFILSAPFLLLEAEHMITRLSRWSRCCISNISLFLHRRCVYTLSGGMAQFAKRLARNIPLKSDKNWSYIGMAYVVFWIVIQQNEKQPSILASLAWGGLIINLERAIC